MNNLVESMRVTVPEGEIDGMTVSRITVTGKELENLQYAARGRACRPGEYTTLREDGDIWMSDTTAERWDHIGPLWAMDDLKAKRVLLNGLGLGMVLQASLTMGHIEHVDVVEIDQRVIDLVGPHYLSDSRVHIIHADAYEQAKRWPKGIAWDVAWHDIWPSLCSDNLPEMARLHRAYARRTEWQGSWGRKECQRLRIHDRALERQWGH